MAINKPVFELTKEGVEKLRAELEELKDVKRPEVVRQLQEARAQGDLSENADYDAAREAQAHTEGRIKEIENILDNYKIIRVTSNDDKVNIGKTIKIKFIERKKEATYKLVGTIEANPAQNLISIESPVGKAVLGTSVGDTISVRLENGNTFHVEVLEIS
ncbi:MAG: transcription elongation factor GreA [Acholeplasmataceae bacterium]|nr:transcription elongation factor GreA [Acholeplasmataceae bacterium]MDD4203989.1 transcription elongation factor GreA [Acholeplasmataceae bacterium]MDD4468761.1 transcription elongation factor GreA [Acholeplasmataceae bacterium]MDD4823821.1 transcription elongation factor GreA [Acholeplasmataceae bacterium]